MRNAVIIGVILLLGGGGLVYHQDQTKKQLAAEQASQAQQATDEAQQQASQQTSQKAAQKTALQDCINTANQQEISSLQYEDNLLKTQSIDPSIVNSYVSEVQQQAQTQITECQAEYPQS